MANRHNTPILDLDAAGASRPVPQVGLFITRGRRSILAANDNRPSLAYRRRRQRRRLLFIAGTAGALGLLLYFGLLASG